MDREIPEKREKKRIKKREDNTKTFLRLICIDAMTATSATIISMGIAYPIKLNINQNHAVYTVKGHLNGVIKFIPTQALNFCINGICQRHSKEKLGRDCPEVISNMLMGGISGVATLVHLYPITIIKQKALADQRSPTGPRQYSGLWKQLYNGLRSSPRSLFRGLRYNLLPTFVFRSCFFGLYESGKDLFRIQRKDSGSQVGFFHRLFLATVVSFFSSTVSQPFTIVGILMTTQEDYPKKREAFKNTFDCWKKIWKKDGIKGYYPRGLSVLLYPTVNGALSLALFDELKELIWN